MGFGRPFWTFWAASSVSFLGDGIKFGDLGVPDGCVRPDDPHPVPCAPPRHGELTAGAGCGAAECPSPEVERAPSVDGVSVRKTFSESFCLATIWVMKRLEQQVIVNQPVDDVFAFIVDPANTPQWVDSIVAEETNEWPVGLGTVYRNRNHAGEWSEYVLAEFEPAKIFTLTTSDGRHLRYTFASIDEGATEVTYEWIGEGNVTESLLKEILTNLKTVVEAKSR